MKNTGFVLLKVDLQLLIDLLVQAYNDGANFVDLHAENDGVRDILSLRTIEEYYKKEDEEHKKESVIKLSDDIIKLLINLN
jgi:hypothetical protein